ncbi:MAG: hypothetical protein ACQCN4_03695 [Candidatus Bathyarchaeia archaeon]|jgi:hypothetical protein
MKKLDGIRDVFKHTKRRHATAIFCPRCGSPKIQLAGSLEVWLTPKQYYCSECGYHGILVMELEPIEETANSNNEEKENEPADLKENEK